MIHLHHLAEAMNVRVLELPLREWRGAWHYPSRTIVVSNRLTTPQKRATFAHELGHAYYGDRQHADSDSYQERRATAWAAQTLITPDAYAEAEALYGPHPGALAQQLGVTREIIDAWRDCYRKAA